MKKYELIREQSLFRIVALKDFSNVKKGDLGGLIEKEGNLDQQGNCWVYGNARIIGDAFVGNNARVSGNAFVGDKARIIGNAFVGDNARVSGNASVYDNAKIYGNARIIGDAFVCDTARVYGNAFVGDNARVSGDAEATKEVITFGNTFDYDITITDNHIKIGCQQYLKSRWLEFTNKEILEMGGKRALKFWGLFEPFAINMGFFN